jgi:hypothetical protein
LVNLIRLRSSALLGIVAWIVFPRLTRFLLIAVVVLIGVAWLTGLPPSSPADPACFGPNGAGCDDSVDESQAR